jgi:hypothetical protein
MRHYRDSLNSVLTWFAIARAVVSVGALATWAVVKEHPMLWGGVIAAAQVTEAVERATGLPARARGTHALMIALDALFIDCQMEWEDVYAGRLDEDEIAKRRHALMVHRHEADAKNLPGGLRQRRKLLTLAERDAEAYFEAVYGSGREK